MKIKFPPVSRIIQTFKESLLTSLCQHIFYDWLEKHDPKFNHYSRQHLNESFKDFSSMLSACLYDLHLSSGNQFTLYRDALLKAAYKQLAGEHLTSDEEQTLACFEDFICKSTTLTPKIVRERMSLVNWKYSLVERGLWKDVDEQAC